MSQHCVSFKTEYSPIHFLRVWAAPFFHTSESATSSPMWPWPDRKVIRLKPSRLSWLAVVQIQAPQPSCLSWIVFVQMSRKQKQKRQLGPASGCPKFLFSMRQFKKGAQWGPHSLHYQNEKMPTSQPGLLCPGANKKPKHLKLSVVSLGYF